jgi:S1-C subfamily serine protease
MRLRLGIGLILAALVTFGARAAEVQRPGYKAAAAAFYRLSEQDRIEVTLLLIAAGHSNGVVTRAFGPRIYDSIAEFQAANGLSMDGIIGPTERQLLRLQGGPVFAAWNMSKVSHPITGTILWVPAGLGLRPTSNRRGLAFENGDASLAVDFSYFPFGDVSPQDLYDRLGTATPTRQILFKVMRKDFFAIAGKSGDRGFYTRYRFIENGSVGFTVSWLDGAPFHGDRLATVMSSFFAYASDPSPSTVASPPMSTQAPSTPSYAGSSSQTVAKAEPEAKSEPTIATGSGFFVTNDGRGLTNAHVVEGCQTALIRDYGMAKVVARDTSNDLALLKLDTGKETHPVKFRNKPIQLGETVFALGYPLAGQLDNGLNFTNGLVSSLAGTQGDSRAVQFTAPIQPGNSGGPLIDKSGLVIGVVRAKLNELASLRDSGSLPQNVNFGIKGDLAANFLRAQGLDPTVVDAGAPLEPTDIAKDGRTETFQVVCVPQP